MNVCCRAKSPSAFSNTHCTLLILELKSLTVYYVLPCSSEETRLKQEEQPTWSTRTYLTPRTLATICQVSTSATATWWCSTTTQTEYVSAMLFHFVMITSKYTVNVMMQLAFHL